MPIATTTMIINKILIFVRVTIVPINSGRQIFAVAFVASFAFALFILQANGTHLWCYNVRDYTYRLIV